MFSVGLSIFHQIRIHGLKQRKKCNRSSIYINAVVLLKKNFYSLQIIIEKVNFIQYFSKKCSDIF